jgi:Holliday junction DNA helicase RuvA
MIRRIKGKLIMKSHTKVYLDVKGICYEINIPKTVYYKLNEDVGKEVELVTYHYLHMEKNKSIPIMIGFTDELEREFFEKFISVSGIGPRAALKAFDKPISLIAQAIEEADTGFLNSLEGIGRQKARQIIAHLQGKVGRFTLLREETKVEEYPRSKELKEEAKLILKRLGYNAKEIDSMIKKAWDKNPNIESVEELLNEIYYEKK